MTGRYSLQLLLLIAATQILFLSAQQLLEHNITVPSDYPVKGQDAYVCVVQELPPQPHKLAGVVPLGDESVVHHILLYGCQKPIVSPQPGKPAAWDCLHHTICDGSPGEIMYGWGRNAGALQLPAGVAFSVGPGTNIRYIVAQVHFKGVRPPNDVSGVTLKLNPEPTTYAAGIITYASAFAIPANTPSTKIKAECCYQGHQPLTTFAFRVHTHALGRNVSMDRPIAGQEPEIREQLAANNPLKPQAFYPVKQQVIWPGDYLQVTCDFNSIGRDRVTLSGPTEQDEMCNMYMMVYAAHPFLATCGGTPGEDSFEVSHDNSPGTLPYPATLVQDPCQFWKPPGNELLPATPNTAAVQPAAGTLAAELGDVSGVAVGVDGTLWVLYRGPHHWTKETYASNNVIRDKSIIDSPVILQLEAETGKVLRRIGSGLFSMPHMISLDKWGNIWVTDTGTHMVYKLNSQGQVLMSLGTQFEPGGGTTHFCKPTHVAVSRDGSFFVSDGYCNNRIIKFASDGTFQEDVLVPKTDKPNPVVHSLLLDECDDVLYVALREVGMVWALDSDTLQEVSEPASLTDTNDKVWSMMMGPYGVPLAVTWVQGKDAMLVDVVKPGRKWTIPGSQQLFPHQIAMGAASPSLSGAADRLFALYVTPTCTSICGPLRKYIFLPPEFKIPPASQLETPLNLPVPEGQPLTLLYGTPTATTINTGIHKQDPLQPGTGTGSDASRAAAQIPQGPGSQASTQQESNKQGTGDTQSGIAAAATSQGGSHQGQQEDLFVHLDRDNSRWRGTVAARALAFGSFAAIMAAVFWVAGKKLMPAHGVGDGGEYARVGVSEGASRPQNGGANGRQGRHRQADMVELLARSAELNELVEEGNGHQGFSHDVETAGTGRPAAASQLHARHHT